MEPRPNNPPLLPFCGSNRVFFAHFAAPETFRRYLHNHSCGALKQPGP
jgi:hypothetical protein